TQANLVSCECGSWRIGFRAELTQQAGGDDDKITFLRDFILDPRHHVRIERSVRIPMRDGMYLSADLIRPDVPGKFPALVEYHPYRKDDNSRSSLNWHHYFAQRGFVGVRLDVRGT